VIVAPAISRALLYNRAWYTNYGFYTQTSRFHELIHENAPHRHKAHIINSLRTLVLYFAVFVVRLFDVCAFFPVCCTLCTQKVGGRGGFARLWLTNSPLLLGSRAVRKCGEHKKGAHRSAPCSPIFLVLFTSVGLSVLAAFLARNLPHSASPAPKLYTLARSRNHVRWSFRSC
jgi:hypothetical protein